MLFLCCLFRRLLSYGSLKVGATTYPHSSSPLIPLYEFSPQCASAGSTCQIRSSCELLLRKFRRGDFFDARRVRRHTGVFHRLLPSVNLFRTVVFVVPSALLWSWYTRYSPPTTHLAVPTARCNRPPINGQCINRHTALRLSSGLRKESWHFSCNLILTHFAQSSKMGKVTKGFDARLANRPFLVFDFRSLWRSGLSARKLKIKNDRLASLASNPWIIVQL